MLKDRIRPYLDILRLSWPLALGMMNNALLQFTDRAFLAKESMASLEAVLPAAMLSFIALSFFQSVVAYAGTFVAQYHGAGDEGGVWRSYRAGLWIALVSGVVTFALLPVGAIVFDKFSNGAEVIARQKAYFNICTSGGVFLFGQMAVQAFFTGLGRTRIVLWVNILGNAVNLALDPILIFGCLGCPRLGIAGAAYATVASMAVQMLVLLVAAHRMPRPRVASAPLLPLVGRILRYGIPSGAYSVLNILSFTVFVFFTGRIGHVEAAVSNACFSVSYLLFSPMEGVALGAATLVGQRRGAGDDDGAMRVGLRTVLIGVVFSGAVSLLALVFRHPILSLYAPSDPEAAAAFHALGGTLFVMLALWQVFDAADVILSGALKGAGDTRFVMGWMLIVAFGLWLPLVVAVARLHNTMTALWGTILLYVVVICIGSALRWFRGCWRPIRLVGESSSSTSC